MSSTLVLGGKRVFCSVLEGRLKPPAFQFQLFPALKVPGYFRGVPLGRKNWLISISGNDSNTDDDNRDHFYNGM